MKPADHKLVLEVFDENRLTRDDFLGMRASQGLINIQLKMIYFVILGRVELMLQSLPRESDSRTSTYKKYILQPRSARSKVF